MKWWRGTPPLAWVCLVLLVVADLLLPGNVTGTLAFPPTLTAVSGSRRQTALVGAVAIAVGYVLIVVENVPAGEAVTREGVVVAASILAVVVTSLRDTRERRLLDVTAVADAAQQALLAAPPERLGAYRLAAAYRGAARGASIGGDLYEVVPTASGVRVLVGDVRGKGLRAVRLATVTNGSFREHSPDCPTLDALARIIDERLQRHLGEEDFVTACMVELRDDGTATIARCGSPAPVLAHAGALAELEDVPSSLPFGLGADPEPVDLALEPGDRLLLFTDGLSETRGRDGRFVPVEDATQPLLSHDDPQDVLRAVLARLRQLGGDRPVDDLALCLAEYAPDPS